MIKITTDDVRAAVIKNISIDTQFSPNYKCWKTMHFNPVSSMLTVKFCDGDCITSNSFDEVLEAIEKYNSYEL